MAFSLTTLKADILSWLENETVAEALTTIVYNGEQRIYRDLDVQGMETSTEGTISPGACTFPRPGDLLAPRYCRVIAPDPATGGTKSLTLRLEEVEFLYEFCPSTTLQGAPRYYAVQDWQTYRVAPYADNGVGGAGYEYELGYKRRWPPLSDAAPTNWLTDNAYDLLLAACLAEGARFVLDDRQSSLVGMWENRYNDIIQKMMALEGRAGRDDYRVPYISLKSGA